MKNGLLKTCVMGMRTPKVFSVDINDDEIKVFQIENAKSKKRTIGWSRKSLPKKIFDNFVLKDKNTFIQILKEAMDGAKGKRIRGNAVSFSIPENKVFLRILQLPLMSKEEAKESIKWEVESNIPISINDVYFDWQIVERKKSAMKVLVVACPKVVIDNLVDAFRMANLRVLTIEADSVAAGRGVLSEKNDEPILVVDIGISNTSYFIFQKGYPVFSSSSSVSGKMFTDILSKDFSITLREAEKYKKKVGLGSTKKERSDMLSLYNPLLSSLVSEIERTISFFDDKLIEEKGINSIIVSGGGSNLKGLIPYLSINLKKKINQSNPWENIAINKDLPPISIEEAQSYVTSIGLSLRKEA